MDAALPRELTDPAGILSKRSIYFDSTVRRQGRVQGSRQPPTPNSRPPTTASFKVLVQGNTDERGSREYNLSLGQKRADAVKKRSLALLGAQEDQIESVSLGEENRRTRAMTKAAWAEKPSRRHPVQGGGRPRRVLPCARFPDRPLLAALSGPQARPASSTTMRRVGQIADHRIKTEARFDQQAKRPAR